MTGPEHPTPDLPDDAEDEAVVLGHVRQADVVFLAYLDAWIDKTVRDGTLTPAKAARYREAIAARCAQLGEVPNIAGAVQRLDLKPGDTLAVIAPIDNVRLLQQMSEHLAGFFERSGVRAVVFPPGTEIKVLHPGPRRWEYPVGITAPRLSGVPSGRIVPRDGWPEPGTAEYDAMKKAHWERLISDGVMTKDEALAEIREADRREGRWTLADTIALAKDTLVEVDRRERPVPPYTEAESVSWTPPPDSPTREP